jgi:sensor c-di-GMP phosphodiesterase-like protein
MAVSDDITPDAVHEGIVRNELFLEYLPTIALQEYGRCVGCEALVRWRRGAEVLYPADFVPTIEDTPVSGLLTYWVIDTVARELGNWLREHRSAHVGINVPPEVLGRGGLEYASRKAALFEVRRQIILEITERGIPDRLGLNELKHLIREHQLIAMDDVNLDDSNFIVLSRQPIPVIKLDKDFVDSLTRAGGERLEQIAAFIRLPGHYVVAEGVETVEQEHLLRDLGVQYAEGWLYTKAISAERLKAFYASRQ